MLRCILSLPDNRTGGEQHHSSKKVTNTKTQYSFLRWTLPAKAGMKMLLPEVLPSFIAPQPGPAHPRSHSTVHSVDVGWNKRDAGDPAAEAAVAKFDSRRFAISGLDFVFV